jgi:hypothetical protein
LARIFFALALIAIAMLVTNLILGLMIGDFNGAAQRNVAAKRQLETLKPSQTSPEVVRQAEQDRRAALLELGAMKPRRDIHFLLGVAASLVTVLVNSITVTYFIGTSRWCREVVDSYSLDPELAQRSIRLKRRTFPWSLGGILMMLTIAALGGASDPLGYFVGISANFVTWHYVTAVLGTGFIAWALLVQVGNIGANYEIIEEILARVRQVRAERGLEPTADPMMVE